MFNLKKKLGALIPGEGARDALQNVLTVEWSGHKTVLVEVPNAAPARTNEVEMLGMSDRNDYGDYGRLIDVDEEEEQMYQKSRGYFNRPRPEREWDDDSPPALPPKPTLSSSSSSYNTKQYSSKTPAHRSQSNNPFNVDRDVLDFDSRTSEKTQHASHYNDGSRQQRDLLSFDEPERGWYNFSESDSTAAADPWAGRGWGTGNGQGQASPASSTGTRMSKDTIVEDPFRN